MNTVAKGDSFEKRSYDLLVKAINEGQFGFVPEYARVFQKKAYYSQLRKKGIIFDLSIEIWPPKAERFSILYLIECKDYATKTVPVDDVEEFLSKIHQVAGFGFFIKGAMIANGAFSSGGQEIARNARLMLMEVGTENTLSIKLHKMQRKEEVAINSAEFEAEKVLEKFIHGVFSNPHVEGLHRLSKLEISVIATKLIQEVDVDSLRVADPISVERITDFFRSKHALAFDFSADLPSVGDAKIWGLFDNERSLIQIDKELLNSERFAFAFAHELGHFVLHRNLRINQQLYNDFRDSEYDVLEDRHKFTNYRHWIEWQANCFGAALIVPKESLEKRLILKQLELGISKTGHIYLDKQPVNQRDYRDILTYLSAHFNTTRTTIVYKLEEFGLITYNMPKDTFRTEIRNIYKGIDVIENIEEREQFENNDPPF